MEQQKFIELLKKPQVIAKDDLNELLELRNNFPYFQLSHILVTLATYKTRSIYFEEHLKKAALYTTNRKKLKFLLESSKIADTTDQELSTEDNIALLKQFQEEIIPAEPAIFATVEVDIPEASEYEAPLLDDEPNEDPINEAETPTQNDKQEATESHVSRIIPKKDVSNSIIHNEAIDNYRIQDSPFDSEIIQSHNQLSQKMLESETDSDLKSDDPIELFLKNPPKHKKANPWHDDNSNKEDLSERFTNNSDDFFSESLANIYKKQGKYAKAIETYKKLILTNPQKSAYFASKILEIENLL